MKERKPYKMIEHEVSVQVSEGVYVTVIVRAPDNMRPWKLVRLGAIKLGLIQK